MSKDLFDKFGDPRDGSLAPRPGPEPLALSCPSCKTPHVDEGEWETNEHTHHRCHTCGHVWAVASHPTVGVPHDDVHRRRLIHESLRIEKALDHFHFDPKQWAQESSFDRMLDALAAAEKAGNDLERERNTARTQLSRTRRTLDSVLGLVHTLVERSGLSLNEIETRLMLHAQALADKPTPQTELDAELLRLRSDVLQAKEILERVVEATLLDEHDEEEDRPWIYCVLCEDEAIPGEPGHGRSCGCVIADAREILEHLRRPGPEGL